MDLAVARIGAVCGTENDILPVSSSLTSTAHTEVHRLQVGVMQ